MTIAAYISSLLAEYEDIDIDIDHVKDGSDQYGLYKAPNRSVTEFTDGSYEITEYYQFFARQSSVSRGNRQDSDEWLEKLTYWADDYRFLYEFPEIDGGRRVTNLAVSGIPYPIESGSSETLYQMSLAITYTREREE